MTRHDMLVELVTDQINSIEQMFRDDEYTDVHRWLHPILLRELKLDYADWSDADLESYYCDQLGVDIPSSPPLSSVDVEEEIPLKVSEEDQAYYRALPIVPNMECEPVPSVHTISDAEGVAEMAAKIRGATCRQEILCGLKPETEVRIPMRLLLRLVHGEGS